MIDGYDAGSRSFYRGGSCCLLTVNDAGIWWGHLGLSRDHAHHGSRYIALRPTPVFGTEMPPCLTGETMGQKWWVGFEGGYSSEVTLETLKYIADQLDYDRGP